MVPLKTTQGLSPSDIKAMIGNRPVYVWGGGPVGRQVILSLRKSGISPAGLIDGRTSVKSSSDCYSLPVFKPEVIVADRNNFVIIANHQVKNYAEKLCIHFGRMRMKDYLTHYEIRRPEAAVDIAGMCNIKCPSCPRGNMENLRPEGFMPLATYKKVLKKLLTDVPLLTNIELFTWGEPLLNPHIADIIKVTEKEVSCVVATNLSKTDMLKPVIQANPSQLIITVNGFDRQYENNMPGASWTGLLRNLETLSSLHTANSSTTDVTLHVFSCENNNSAFKFMSDLAAKLNFRVVYGSLYLNPYEHYLNYTQGNNVSQTVREAIRNSPWNFEKMLLSAEEEREKPCLCQRIFPIINWDLSVALCHVYYGPVIAENYLITPWQELISLRHNEKQCRLCQSKALHRLDLDLLEKNRINLLKENLYAENAIHD